MAQYPSRRLPARYRRADQASLQAIRQLKAYAPVTPEVSVGALDAADAAMQAARQAEMRARLALKQARLEATAAEWQLHQLLDRAKDHISAQYGSDSFEVQAVGRTRRSHYRKPGRKRTR